jgi:hypothetical protein
LITGAHTSSVKAAILTGIKGMEGIRKKQPAIPGNDPKSRDKEQFL